MNLFAARRASRPGRGNKCRCLRVGLRSGIARFKARPYRPGLSHWAHASASVRAYHVWMPAAFLASIDSLLRQAIDHKLTDETQVIYVSPLKALSNDIRRNLQAPLEEIRNAALAAGAEPQEIRVAVRTGDTPSSERQKMLRKPPHILVTTPESLYLLLTSA